MKNILMTTTYALILNFSIIYVWHKLQNQKINFKGYKLYICLIGMMLASIFNYFKISSFIKITICTIYLMFFFKYIFKSSLHKSIVTPIFSQILIMISEALYAVIIMLLHIDINLTLTSFLFNVISNIFISIIFIILSKTSLIKKIYKKFLNITDKINYYQLSTFCIIAILIANVLSASSYYKIKFEYLFTFNMIMTLICFIIIIYSFKTKNNLNKVSDKYNVATNSLKDYENMMHKYRIANHENKNLMLTVRAMILNKEKNIPKYIDSMIEERYNDDEKLLFKMSVIPSGGLRATIYSEILKIKENSIEYSLNIDKEIKTIDLIELNTNTIIGICKIIGVFIDNAIEEVKNKKQKNIDISIFALNNTINIKVSNNYNGKLNLNLIGNEGYTTKGDGHGYGLSLVKNIVNENPAFRHYTDVSKNVFCQTLSIQYKKTL